jgi:hypothetical protein
MAKLVSLYQENFEACFASYNSPIETAANWYIAGASPNNPSYFYVDATGAIEGTIGVLVQGPPGYNADIFHMFLHRIYGAIGAYEVRWRHQNTVAAYPAATNKPFYLGPKDKTMNVPWYIEIHSDAVKFWDGGGLSASIFAPGTTAHQYRVTDDGAGNLTVYIDGTSYYTGTAAVIANPIDRLGIGHAQDALNGSYNIFTGHLDDIEFVQSIATSFNVARIFVGK